MRLLMLTENYPPNSGGMAQSCDRIVANLRAAEVNVEVMHFTNHCLPFKLVEKVNGAYVALPKHNDTAHGLNLVLSYFEHHVDIAKFDYMLVFGGNTPMLAAPTYSRLLGLDYYLCLRGNDFDISLFDPKRRVQLDSAVYGAKGVFVGSHDKLNRLRRLYPDTPAFYSPSSIDLQNWQAFASEQTFASTWRETHLSAGQIAIGLIGYLKTKKGVRFFLDALRKSDCRERVHLLLSGEQPEEVLDVLHENQLEFTLIPVVDRFELVKYLLACDWLAIPSYYEGMPNIMLEAGGLGVPVLASSLDGMRDVVEHKRTGLLFRPLDIDDCAKQITYCVNMPRAERNAIGHALQEKITRDYTPQAEAQIYLQVFGGQSESKDKSTYSIIQRQQIVQ